MKPKTNLAITPPIPPPPDLEEKKGFFERFFGGSKPDIHQLPKLDLTDEKLMKAPAPPGAVDKKIENKIDQIQVMRESVDKEHRTKKEELKNYERELNHKEALLKESIADHDRKKQTLERIAQDAKKREAELHAKREELRKKEEELERKAAKIPQENRKANMLERENVELHRKVEEHAEKVRALEQVSRNRSMELEQMYRELKKKESLLQDREIMLRSQPVSQDKAQQEEFAKKRAEIESAKKQLEEQRKQYENAQKQLSMERKQHEEERAKIEQNRKQVELQRAAHEAERKRLEQIRIEHENARKQIEKQKYEHESAQKQVERQKREFLDQQKQLERSRESLEKDKSEHQKDIQNLEQQEKQLEAKIQDVQKRLQEINSQKITAERELKLREQGMEKQVRELKLAQERLLKEQQKIEAEKTENRKYADSLRSKEQELKTKEKLVFHRELTWIEREENIKKLAEEINIRKKTFAEDLLRFKNEFETLQKQWQENELVYRQAKITIDAEKDTVNRIKKEEKNLNSVVNKYKKAWERMQREKEDLDTRRENAQERIETLVRMEAERKDQLSQLSLERKRLAQAREAFSKWKQEEHDELRKREKTLSDWQDKLEKRWAEVKNIRAIKDDIQNLKRVHDKLKHSVTHDLAIGFKDVHKEVAIIQQEKEREQKFHRPIRTKLIEVTRQPTEQRMELKGEVHQIRGLIQEGRLEEARNMLRELSKQSQRFQKDDQERMQYEIEELRTDLELATLV